MSTLVTRTIETPVLPLGSVFARIASALRAVVEIFEESRELAREAHARYPFTNW